PVRLAERPAEDGEVLAVDRDLASVHGAVPRDDAVARDAPGIEAEGGGAVPDERVELDEAALVEQGGDALAGRLLAAGVLPLRGGRVVGGRGGPGGEVVELGG